MTHHLEQKTARPTLESLISHEELLKKVSGGKTLQSIVDEVFEKTGFRFSSPACSKLCKKLGIECQRSGPRSGHLHKGWKGGRIQEKHGYISLYAPDHPHRRKHTPYVLEHRLVMESHLGRYLSKSEVVHHKNGDKTDNRIENLELFESNAKHLAETLAGKVPKWTKEGLENMSQACRQTKPHTYVSYTPAERESRRARCLLLNATRKVLKLDAQPSKEDVDRYLAQLGISRHEALEKALRHEL